LLLLATTTPALEFPRANLPPSVKFVGPLLPETADGDWVRPPWWDELLSHPRESVIHVTQGTVAENSDMLVKPALRALEHVPGILVVITLTARDAATAFPTDGADKLPSNVRVAEFVPHTRLLPHVGIMVTNAGFGGVLAALSCGVPLVCAGRTEDKAEVTARVVWSGAGLDLGTNRPTEDAIRRAVLAVKADARYAKAAQRVQADFAKHHGPAECVNELELAVRKAGAARSQTDISLEASN
jgi:UDP:flavonoid glycosyltransferase YjiC (YdhE family)